MNCPRLLNPVFQSRVWKTASAVGFVVLSLIILASSFQLPASSYAATGINKVINFQGKVTNSNGTNVTDGTYDFTFKLYNGAGSGATTLFTETWSSAALFSSTMSSAPASGGESLTYSSDTNEATLKPGQILWNTTKKESVKIVAVNTATNTLTISPTKQAWATSDTITNKIYVKSGLFTVAINGLNQDLSGVDFNSDSIYLGINFNADGEMKPRIQFAAVPYAFNAEKVNGLAVTNTAGNPVATGTTLKIADSKTVTFNNGLAFSGVDGKTITFNNSLTFSGTDGDSFTLPSGGGTLCVTGGTCAASSLRLDQLAGATSGHSLDNLNNGQTWNWTTLTSQTALALAGGSAMTSGKVLNVTGDFVHTTNDEGNALHIGYSDGSTYNTAVGYSETVGLAIDGYFSATGASGTHETHGIWVKPLNIVGTPTGTNVTVGMSIGNQGGTGITNAYGLYIDPQTGATNNYAAYFGGAVGIGTATPNAELEVNGALRLSSTTQDTYTTPQGTGISSKINIPNFDPGAFNQILALGLPSTANTNARAISIFDGRTSAHQPTINVWNAAETDLAGISWDGTSTAYLKSLSSNLGIRIGTTDIATFNTSGQAIFNNNVGISATSPTAQLQINGRNDVALTGTVAATNGSGSIVGTGTSFTTQLKPNQAIKIAGTTYSVYSIVDDTHLSLYTSYSGTTASGLSATTDPSTMLAINSGDNKNILNLSNAGVMQLGSTNGQGQLQISNSIQVPIANIEANTTNNGLVLMARTQNDTPEYGYQPGLVWATSDNNPTKPKAGIWAETSANGSYMYLGTTNNYAAGINNQAITIDYTGSVGINNTNPTGVSLNVGGTGASSRIIQIGYASANTLGGILTGINMDLTTNITQNNQTITGLRFTPPLTNTFTNTSGTVKDVGLSIGDSSLGLQSSFTMNGSGGSAEFDGFDVTNPNITQTTGTITANGVKVTTGSITTGGTQNGLNIVASGVGAGALNGLNISSITGGAGTETGIAVGSGWDYAATFQGNVGIGTTTPGSKLTINDGSLLQSTPTNPTVVGGSGITTPSRATQVVVQGNYAYEIFNNTGTNAFRIMNVTNPAAPAVVGGTSYSGCSGTSGGEELAVAGSYAYLGCTGGSGSTVEIVNVSNPAAPSLAGTVSSLPNSLSAVAVQGKYLFVGTNDATATNAFRVIDVSNPASPVVVGGSSYNPGGGVNGIQVVGKYAYLAINESGCSGVRVVDISNPSSPSQTGTVSLGCSLSAPYNLAISGAYVYVPSDQSASGTAGLRIVDVSNPASPTVVGGSSLTLPSHIIGLYASGSYVYAMGQNTGTNTNIFRIIDVSDPTTPVVVGGTNLSLTLGSSGPSDLIPFVAGRYAYLPLAQTVSDTNGFRIVDITGVQAVSLTAGSLKAGQLQVAGNLVGGLLYANSATLGDGGLASSGRITGQNGLVVTGGNVGIGTSTPAELLNIYNGNAQLDYGNLKMNTISAPGAPTVAVNATAGNLNGTYYYKVTFVTASGETEGGTTSASVSPASQQVNLTAIPVGTSRVVTARKIYRTSGSSTSDFQLVTTINDNTTTTYTDNLADSSRTTNLHGSNTTGNSLYVNGSLALNITSSLSNSSFGTNALTGITTGYNNLALGTSSLLGTTTGNTNTAAGANTLQVNTTGSGNSAFGASALSNNSIGGGNTAVGSGTMSKNSSGSDNTAIGYSADFGYTPGAPTTAVAAGGSVDVGIHYYKVTYVINGKETEAGSYVGATTTAGNQTVNLSSISVESYGFGATARKVYRTKLGGTPSSNFYLVTTINNNTTTTYTDTLADSSLGSTYFGIGYTTIIGANATALYSNQLVLGGANAGQGLSEGYFGSGIISTAPTSFILNATGGQGTNVAGANLTLAAGRGTGTAAGGSLLFQTSAAGSTGTSLNALTTRMSIDTAGLVAINDTSGTINNTLKVNGSLCVKNGTGACTGNTAGTIYAGNTTVQAADLAENYISSQALEPGDVVVAANDGNSMAVVKSTSSNQTTAIGIVSTKPGVTLNSDATVDNFHTHLYAIGLAGRVPVKVSTENGAIHVGDFLTTSSTPGVAMKAIASGVTIARALENYTDTATGTITAFANVSYYNPGSGPTNTPTDLAAAFQVGQAEISTNLDLKVMGKITAQGGLTVGGPAEFQGPAIFRQLADFFDNVIFHKDVQVDGHLTLNQDAAGFATIHKGDQQVTVTFSKPYATTPIIVANPVAPQVDQTNLTTYATNNQCGNSDTVTSCQDKLDQLALHSTVTYIVTSKSASSFTIKLPAATTTDQTFSWTAIAINNPTTFQSTSDATTKP